MSLIADALKKAQSAKLGRRYAVPDPAGVLPRPKGDRRSPREVFLSSILNRVQLSPTLLIGLGSGAFLFVVLFSYFFLSGRGPRAGPLATGSSVASANRPAGLILTPPPSIASVEPLVLEETAPAGKAGETAVAEKKSPELEKAEEKRVPAKLKARDDLRKPAERRKTGESAKESEAPKVAVAPDLSEEVRRHFNLALFYQEEKNFPLARRAYEKVVQMWPLYAEAHNNLGVVYKELGLYDKGVTELKKALALNSRYPRAYHNLGVIYQIKGDWTQAIRNYELALSLDHNHLSTYNNLGLVYRSQKRPHEAREVLEKALAINSAFAQTHYNLALVLEEIGELDRARFHFQKFIDLSGEENRTLVEKVRAHLQELLARK